MTSSAMLRTFAPALAALLGLASWLAAADLQVAATEAAPPEEVSAEVRDAVGAGSLKVSGGGEDVAEFWLRDALPAKQGAAEALGVSFPGLEQGTLVGVVRLAKPWREYKDLAVPPGVYTLRYALRPADGNHMGVSTYRDFLLLTPAAEDPGVDPGWKPEELYSKSMAATKQPHPASMAVFPVWDEVKEPTIVANDVGQPMLAVRLGDLQLGLVIEGHGEA